VASGGDAEALGAQAGGHELLVRGGPGVVVFAVEHECRDVAVGEGVRLVPGAEQLAGHRDQADRVVAQHAVLEEREDPGRGARLGRLGFQGAAPDLFDLALQLMRGGSVEEGQHGAELFGAVAGQGGGARAHQGQRAGSAAAENRLPDDQAAEGVAEQVDRLGRPGHGRDIGAQLRQAVRGGVVGAWRLVLAAHVDREHPAPSGRELAEHGDEVLLAARVAGDEQRGAQLTRPRRRECLERGERAARGRHRHPPRPVRQVERGRRGHGQEACW